MAILHLDPLGFSNHRGIGLHSVHEAGVVLGNSLSVLIVAHNVAEVGRALASVSEKLLLLFVRCFLFRCHFNRSAIALAEKTA